MFVIDKLKLTAEELTNKAVEDFINKPIEYTFGQTGSQSLDIDTYRKKFLGTNARSYLFVCNFNFPDIQNAISSGIQSGVAFGGISVSSALRAGTETAIRVASTETLDFKYYVKSSSLPQSVLEETSTYWFGQQLKMSSVRRTEDWQVTFLVDQEAVILKKFWEWHKLMHDPKSNYYGKPTEYMCDQLVQLLGIDGYPICTYRLVNAWPKEIGNVNLDYSNNEFATVDVTFTYQYHTSTTEAESGASRDLKKVGLQAVRNLL